MGERTKLNSPEEALQTVAEKIKGIGKDPWMVVIFRVRGNFISMDRTTNNFPTGKLLECAELFSGDMAEEKKRSDEENDEAGYGIVLPRDPLPPASVDESPNVFRQIRDEYLKNQGEFKQQGTEE